MPCGVSQDIKAAQEGMGICENRTSDALPLGSYKSRAVPLAPGWLRQPCRSLVAPFSSPGADASVRGRHKTTASNVGLYM